MKILITGSSGFIGFHLSKLLLEKGNSVYGIDSMNNYYDVILKKARLNILKNIENLIFQKLILKTEKKLEIFLIKSNPE